MSPFSLPLSGPGKGSTPEPNPPEMPPFEPVKKTSLNQIFLGASGFALAVLFSFLAEGSYAPMSTFLPFFCILSLILLGSKLSPGLLAASGFAYAGGYLLFEFFLQEQTLTLTLVRGATVVVAGILVARGVRLRNVFEEEFRRLSAAFLQLPLAVVLSDQQGTIRYANKEACRRLGVGQESLVGRSFFSIFSVPEAGGDFSLNYYSLMAAESDQPTRIRLAARNQPSLSLETTILHIKIQRQLTLLTAIHEAGERVSR